MLADPRFAFKLMVECTAADVDVRARRRRLQRAAVVWDEFEFFACDQIAAFAVNTAILTARVSTPSSSGNTDDRCATLVRVSE